MTTSGAIGRMPFYAVTGALAIIFLFPLVWSALASVSPQGGTGQTFGYGLGNYGTLFDFGAGLPRFFLNSVIDLRSHGLDHAHGLALSAAMPSRGSTSPDVSSCSW